MKTLIPFTKMVGAGNDFLLIDTVRHPLGARTPQWRAVSRALCGRHRGIGADGMLVLEPSTMADVRMRVFNPDGSEAKMCGNGARCVARYVHDRRRPARRHQHGSREVSIQTAGGLLGAIVRGDRVRMRLPDPTDLRLGLRVKAAGRTLEVASINTGVPHAVVPVHALDALDVAHVGRALRHHRAFGSHGTNVDFIQPHTTQRHCLRVRTYERGVEGETLACGTGVAASAVVHALTSGVSRGPHRAAGNGAPRAYSVNVETRSGDRMTVSFGVVPSGRGVRVTDLVLEGAARRICDGTIFWPLEGSHHLPVKAAR